MKGRCPPLASWKVFVPVESWQRRGSASARVFILPPINRGGCIFMMCLTLWCFCFLSTNAVQMTSDDPNNIRTIPEACVCLPLLFSWWVDALFILSDTSGPPNVLQQVKSSILCYWQAINFQRCLHPPHWLNSSFHLLWFILHSALDGRLGLFSCRLSEASVLCSGGSWKANLFQVSYKVKIWWP